MKISQIFQHFNLIYSKHFTYDSNDVVHDKRIVFKLFDDCDYIVSELSADAVESIQEISCSLLSWNWSTRCRLSGDRIYLKHSYNFIYKNSMKKSKCNLTCSALIQKTIVMNFIAASILLSISFRDLSLASQCSRYQRRNTTAFSWMLCKLFTPK